MVATMDERVVFLSTQRTLQAPLRLPAIRGKMAPTAALRWTSLTRYHLGGSSYLRAQADGYTEQVDLFGVLQRVMLARPAV